MDERPFLANALRTMLRFPDEPGCDTARDFVLCARESLAGHDRLAWPKYGRHCLCRRCQDLGPIAKLVLPEEAGRWKAGEVIQIGTRVR